MLLGADRVRWPLTPPVSSGPPAMRRVQSQKTCRVARLLQWLVRCDLTRWNDVSIPTSHSILC
jgi:hypothetical protein